MNTAIDQNLSHVARVGPLGWRGRFERFTLHSETLLLLTVVFLLLAANGPFWSALLDSRSFADFATWRFALGSFVALTALHYFVIGLFATRRLLRPLLSVLVFVSVLAGYNMRHYGVVVDPSMVRNVFQTDWREASELLTPSLLLYVCLAALPVAAIWLVRLRTRSRRAALVARAGSLAVALMVGESSWLRLVERYVHYH